MSSSHENKGSYSRSLHSINILRSLSAPELERVSAACRWRSPDPGEEIVTKGAASADVHFIVKGKVRVTIYGITGREVTFRDLSTGDAFGQLSAIDGQERSATVVALAPSTLASLPRHLFLSLLQQHNSVCLDLLLDFTKIIRNLSERLVDLTVLTTPIRVRTELLRMASEAHVENSARIARPPTHAQFASRIGATREAVTRELSSLSRSKIIKREGKTLIITDIKRLKGLIDG